MRDTVFLTFLFGTLGMLVAYHITKGSDDTDSRDIWNTSKNNRTAGRAKTSAVVRKMVDREKKAKKETKATNIQPQVITWIDLTKDAKIFIGEETFKFDRYFNSRIFFISKKTLINLPDTTRFVHVDRHYEIAGRV